jgi:SAM-dependent methyltransferase
VSAPTPTPVRPQDVLGVPLLPPGRITVAGNRLRELLGRVHRSMAPPPVRILEGLFGVLEHRVLVLLCEAGIPDALTGPRSIPDLASEVGADEARLERLLRFASTRGWVRIDRRGRVRPTRITAFLHTDHPGGWRAWVDFAGGDEVVDAVRHLSVRAGARHAFLDANGAPFFEWMADHPDRWETFDRAMAAGGRMHALGLAAVLDWTHGERVCDVGGGTGDLLATLLDLVPDVEGTVFDLPAVVARAVEHCRLGAIGGDAFEQVPAGFDTYLLVNVLHDWDDDDALHILQRVAEAAGPTARIVVVDNDRTPVPRHDIAVSADVLMAALTDGGKERAAAAFAELGLRAGLRLASSHRLPSADSAHVLRPMLS